MKCLERELVQWVDTKRLERIGAVDDLVAAGWLEWYASSPGTYTDEDGLTQRHDRWTLGMSAEQFEREYQLRQLAITAEGRRRYSEMKAKEGQSNGQDAEG